MKAVGSVRGGWVGERKGRLVLAWGTLNASPSYRKKLGWSRVRGSNPSYDLLDESTDR